MTHAAIKTSGTRQWLYCPGASFNGISEPALCRRVRRIERGERRCSVGRGRCNCVVWGRAAGQSPALQNLDQHFSLRPISRPTRDGSSHLGFGGGGATAAARARCSCCTFARICGIAAIAAFSPSRIA